MSAKRQMFAVFGASGYGREVMPTARAAVQNLGHDVSQLVFVDDSPLASRINGHDVLTLEEYVAIADADLHACIAVSSGHLRSAIASRLRASGVAPWTVASSRAVVEDDVLIGEGAILSPFVTLTSNISIGMHFQANLYSYVAHDCRIGDFVTFAPGVKCNGNVVVEDHAYLGTGAILRQGRAGDPLIIGRGSVVGAGAVVTKHVAPGTTVIGNPARPMEAPR